MTRKEIIATLEDIASYWAISYEFNEDINYIVFDTGFKVELIDDKLIVKEILTKEEIIFNIKLVKNIFVDNDKLIIVDRFLDFTLNILN